MVKRKYIAVAVLGSLLFGAGSVRAQGCRVIHSENLGLPNETILFPNEVNGVTATITTSAVNVSGATPSHTATYTPGTQMIWNWTSNQAVSARLLYFDNGTQYDNTPVAVNGSGNSWVINAGSIGHSYVIVFIVADSSGNTTQDRIAFNVVAGNGPSVIYQDDFPTNYYEELKNNFNGTTSMNFEYCPGAATATHTAPFFGSITNPTSGDTQSFNTSIAFRPNGGYNEEVPPTYVSFLPSDKPPQTSTTGRVMCTIAGDFVGLIAATGDNTKNQRVDKTMWTKVKIATSVPAGDGGYYVDKWCIEKETPIWDANEIYTSAAPLNQYYWTGQICSSSPPGTDPGPGWHCPGIAGGPGPGDPRRFFPSFSGVKGSCNTNINTPAPY